MIFFVMDLSLLCLVFRCASISCFQVVSKSVSQLARARWRGREVKRTLREYTWVRDVGERKKKAENVEILSAVVLTLNYDAGIT